MLNQRFCSQSEVAQAGHAIKCTHADVYFDEIDEEHAVDELCDNDVSDKVLLSDDCVCVDCNGI